MRTFIFLLIILFSTISASSQDSLLWMEEAVEEYPVMEEVEVRQIDREKWKEATSGLEYSENIPKEKKEEELDQELPDFESIGRTAEVIKWILIILGVAAIAFILYKILTGDPLFARSDKKLDKSSVSYAENAEEEELMEEVLDDALTNAEKAGNYRLAIRLLFITVLQNLQEYGHIVWKKEKTNLQYYWEIENEEIRPTFKTLSRLYEDAWFGEKPVFEQGYSDQKALFHKFNQAISVQKVV